MLSMRWFFRFALGVLAFLATSLQTEAQWTKHEMPAGARVNRVIRASETYDYCLSGTRIYRRLNEGRWEEVEAPLLTAHNLRFEAWHDTVVAATHHAVGVYRVWYSFDAGTSWQFREVRPVSAIEFLPHSTHVYVSGQGVVSCVNYVSGEAQVVTQMPPQIGGMGAVHAADGHILFRYRTIDSARGIVELCHVRVPSPDVTAWTISFDTATANPFRVNDGGIAFRNGNTVIHYHRGRSDTLVFPTSLSLSPLSNGGLVGHNGRWIAKVIEDRAARLVSSSQGESWSVIETDSRELLDSYSRMYSLRRNRLLFTNRQQQLLEFNDIDNTIRMVHDGMSRAASVCTDGRYVAVQSIEQQGTPPITSFHVNVIDDQESAMVSHTIVQSLSEASAPRVQLVDGTVWIASDSLYGFWASDGKKAHALRIPWPIMLDGGYSVSGHTLLWASGDVVFRKGETDSDWVSIVNLQSQFMEQFTSICHADNGFYTITYRLLPTMLDHAELRVAKYSMAGNIVMGPVAFDTTDLHIRYTTWSLSPLQRGAAITASHRVIATVLDDGGQLHITPMGGHVVANAGRLWSRTASTVIQSYVGAHLESLRYVVPSLPERSIENWFCNLERCYLTTAAGLHSAPFEKGATNVREDFVPEQFGVTLYGDIVVPEAGTVTVFDVHGRIVAERAVQPGAFTLPRVFSGAYCAVLNTASGQARRLVFVR